jgi:hypothetical protein
MRLGGSGYPARRVYIAVAFGIPVAGGVGGSTASGAGPGPRATGSRARPPSRGVSARCRWTGCGEEEEEEPRGWG